jgi:outer membrane biosynthesis protein TonB
MGTKVSRGGRAWVIAGVATLIVAAGAGGFVVATSMGKDNGTHVGAPNPLETTISTDKGSAAAATPDPGVKFAATPVVPPATPVTKPDTATAAGVGVKVEPTAKKVDANKPDPKVEAKTEAKSPKTDAKAEAKSTKTDAAKTDPTKTKTTAKTKTKKSKGDDDLFDDRH